MFYIETIERAAFEADKDLHNYILKYEKILKGDVNVYIKEIKKEEFLL